MKTESRGRQQEQEKPELLLTLLTAPASRSSVFVFVLVFVVTFFFYDIQFDWIESHDLKFSPTFFTSNYFALVRVQIDVDISIAFRASSGRHSLILPALSEGRDPP